MNSEGDRNGPILTFETLPPEIIHSVLTYSSPSCLLSLAQTSKTLRAHAQNDQLWARLIQESVPEYRSESVPAPYRTWRELYLRYHPFWFIPRGKIWFSDTSHDGNELIGSILLARYDPRRACIEAYQLVAERTARSFTSWAWNRDVIIHQYNPSVQLWLENPIFVLRGQRNGYGRSVRDLLEIPVEPDPAGGLRTTIFLCRPVPPQLKDSGMTLWPPAILPATHRVRIESQSSVQSWKDKPQTLDQASDCTFRLRTWLELHGVAAGENVMTFSTLPEEAYTPTKEKPWQGIWVGDYSTHGCEFLAVLQTSTSNLSQADSSYHGAGPISTHSHADSPSRESRPMSIGPIDDSSASLPTEASPPNSEGYQDSDPDRFKPAEELEDGSCCGRLEAIKLTGDQNVPRGVYSWIAEDIGPRGLVRIAEEEPFRGARIVRSIAHLADDQFQNGEPAFLLQRYAALPLLGICAGLKTSLT